MKNKEKYLTNFSEAKRKKATQKYNIIKPFILGEQSLSSISKSKGIALSTLYRWNKSYKEQGLKGLIYATRADKGTRKIEPKIIIGQCVVYPKNSTQIMEVTLLHIIWNKSLLI